MNAPKKCPTEPLSAAEASVSNDILPNAHVLVVGGTKGIGASIVHRCQQRGAKVLVVGRHVLNESASPTVHSLSLDMGESDAVQRIRDSVSQTLGGLDVLVYCASPFIRNRIPMLTDEQWDQMMTINVTRMFQLVRELIPMLKESSYPRIVVISSITGPVTGLPAMSHYGAAKSAVEGFVRSAALEFAESGYAITINTVRPGLIGTAELHRSYGDERIESMNALIPRGRLGTPDEVASAVCYLASPAASFISGTSLTVDGAQTLVENPFAP